MATSAEEKPVKVGFVAAGLFDVLGQQEILRSWTKLPGTETGRDEVAGLMRRTYKTILNFREHFASAFDSFGNEIAFPNLDSEKQSDTLRGHSHSPLKSFGFSDTVVAYLPLGQTEHKLPIRGVYGILATTALIQLGWLAHRRPIRGGIDVGIGFEVGPSEIYGPVLARAHHLESEIAGYPRVVIGNELAKYIDAHRALEPTDLLSTANRNIADRCAALLVEDIDGYPIIDFLGATNMDLNTAAPGIQNLAHDAFDFVKAELDRFRKERHQKLAFRYSHLLNYFEERMPSIPPRTEAR